MSCILEGLLMVYRVEGSTMGNQIVLATKLFSCQGYAQITAPH